MLCWFSEDYSTVHNILNIYITSDVFDITGIH